MPNDRLTIDAARPGMKVRCVDFLGSAFEPDEDCEVVSVVPAETPSLVIVRRANGATVFSYPCRFIPASDLPTLAALLAERAPEFLAAVREWHRICSSWVHFGSPSGRALYEAIERAGLIAQEPRTTEREATIREGWWA